MHIDKERVGNVLVARIREPRITSHEAPEMKTALLEMIVGEEENFLINLRDVENMDSTGLGALLFGIRQAEQHEKDLCFCEARQKVKFLVRIAHLDQVIDVYDTEAEALTDFREGEEG